MTPIPPFRSLGLWSPQREYQEREREAKAVRSHIYRLRKPLPVGLPANVLNHGDLSLQEFAFSLEISLWGFETVGKALDTFQFRGFGPSSFSFDKFF
ncbi:hypothetical protein SAY86_016782 [Trapa natans]|uniref:Uncharacterized protein n=1 Tax=Trapa natans TaxID=22666 RepID=A0AAN7LJL3_TRANT|nr:hypothetical protein SAY86_016782 [Trapa natans]